MDEGVPLTAAPKIGVLAWSFVGVVVATIIVVTGLSAVSEILLPLLFAAVLAVVFKPVVGRLRRHGFKPSLAAGLIVLGLLVLMTVVLVATVRGVVDQTDEIGASVNSAIDKAADELGIDQGSLKDAEAATKEAGPTIGEGVVTALVSGVNSLLGLVSGLILGALIMYYLLKDGPRCAATSSRRSTPRSGARSAISSGMRAGSSATTGVVAPPRPPSSRWSSPSRASCSASRWCSRSSS